MDWFKQLCLSWIIISATAICVSCQELSSTLREGNLTCRGEEVIFTCAVNDSSGLPILVIGWSSIEYIGREALLQFTTNLHMLGANVTSMINENVTATLTKNTNDNGVRMLETMLHIVAVQASVVTCSVTNRDPVMAVSTEFFISAVPEAPQNFKAVEVAPPIENVCIILLTWDHPANTVQSDIEKYIVNVTSRNILANTVTVPITTLSLRIPDCGNNIRFQVAAVSHLGCEGPIVEMQPSLLYTLPTTPSENGTASTEDGTLAASTVIQGGSAPSSSKLSAGAAFGIAIGTIALFILGGSLSIILYYVRRNDKVVIPLMARIARLQEEVQGSDPEYCLLNLYDALRSQSQRKTKNPDNKAALKASDSVIANAVVHLHAVLKKEEAHSVIKDALKISLETIKSEEKKNDIQGAFSYLIEMVSENMSNADDVLKSKIKELSDIINVISEEEKLDDLKEEIEEAAPDEIQKILLNLCDVLLEKLLKLSEEQEKVVRKFEISVESLKEVERLLTAEFAEGLAREGDDVKVKMLNTCVHEMPDETAEGEFLVVDLGVSYLRVLLTKIHEGRITIMEDSDKQFIDKITKNSSSHKDLLDFVARRVAKFMTDKNITRNLPMGFAFPFPMKQESLISGKIIHWGNLKTADAEGEDIIQLLRDAFKKHNVKVDRPALVNDSTGIQLAVGNEVPDCCIGLILGEGTNASYMESLDAVTKFIGDRNSYTHVIINTEWGDFGEDGKLDHWRTEYDVPAVGSHGQELFRYEKMISGKYLGEIVHHALKDLINKRQLFEGRLPSGFEAFNTRKSSDIEKGGIVKCKKIFRKRFKTDSEVEFEVSYQDCEVVRRVCEAVSTRAARLAAAGVVALVKKINKIGEGCTVAVDGFLYRQYPKFDERMKAALNELVPGNNVKMKLIDNGTGRGAAFAAAMASRLLQGGELDHEENAPQEEILVEETVV